MRHFKRALALLALAVVGYSCQKQLDVQKEDSVNLSNQLNVLNQLPDGVVPCGTPVIKDMVYTRFFADYASVGKAMITNDADNYYITLTPEAGSYLTSAIINYGTPEDLSQSLTKDGGLGWGVCEGPYYWDLKETYNLNDFITTKTYTIPRSVVEGDCLSISVVFRTNKTDGTRYCGYVDNMADPLDAIAVGSATYQSYFNYCAQDCPPTECEPLRTQTPGGWGSKPEGNNPGTYLAANFATSFPNGLTIGCDAGFEITLTSAKAIETLLPTGGKAEVLTASSTNPAEIKNVLVGHLVALTLSVVFDQDDADFGAGDNELGSMVIKSGTFASKTVLEFWQIANDVLGGCNTNYTPAQVLETATAINENYVDGKMDNGYLECKN